MYSESCRQINDPSMHRPPDCVPYLEKVLPGSCLQISQPFLYELHDLQKFILAHISGAAMPRELTEEPGQTLVPGTAMVFDEGDS